MLYIDGIGISFLIKELKEKVLNYRLTKIHQYDKSSLTLYFGKQNLLFQVKDNHSMVIFIVMFTIFIVALNINNIFINLTISDTSHLWLQRHYYSKR